MRSRRWVTGFGLLWGTVSTACFSEREGTAPIEGVCSVELGEGFPGSTVVVIRGFTFIPTEVQVRPGGRVTWINCDPEGHTSTADADEWSSPLLEPGQVFSASFSAPGEFSYHCEPHPFMTGTVVVE